jgi:Flp pilus assembly protein TadG
MMTLKYRELLLRLRHNEKGQSIVEIALTLPILATLLLGAAEFARLAYAAIEVSNAAKAGVAYASQNGSSGDTAGIQLAATLDAGNIILNTPTVTVKGVCSSGAACTGTGNTCTNTDCQNPLNPNDHIETIVSVDTSTTFDPVIHVPGFPGSFTLRGHATQICLPQ